VAAPSTFHACHACMRGLLALPTCAHTVLLLLQCCTPNCTTMAGVQRGLQLKARRPRSPCLHPVVAVAPAVQPNATVACRSTHHSIMRVVVRACACVGASASPPCAAGSLHTVCTNSRLRTCALSSACSACHPGVRTLGGPCVAEKLAASHSNSSRAFLRAVGGCARTRGRALRPASCMQVHLTSSSSSSSCKVEQQQQHPPVPPQVAALAGVIKPQRLRHSIQ